MMTWCVCARSGPKREQKRRIKRFFQASKPFTSINYAKRDKVQLRRCFFLTSERNPSV